MSTFLASRFPLVLVVALSLTGCGSSGGGGTTCACPVQQQAAAPTFSPAAGTFSTTQTVTVSDSTAGATIYYTTDGTAPTTSSTVYSAPLAVTASETVEAIATASGYSQSPVATAAYTITVAPPQAAAPNVSTSTGDGAQNGAVIVTLSSTTAGATIYYTIDGSTPTTSSTQYLAPFLVASSSSVTLNAIATASGDTNSSVTTQTFQAIASDTLVWSDEFQNTGTTNTLPSATNWTYDTGYQCCGNDEQETYCAAGSSTSPCSAANPNAFIAPGGGLNIVAENPSGTTYTSARLKSQGLFSFMYGRIEAKMLLPESQGMWPAFWLLGDNITTINWPLCGELDVMEHIDGNDPPPYAGAAPEGYDWIAGSVHGGTSGDEENGSEQYPSAAMTPPFSAAAWHTYGMIWTKGEIQYYIDLPSNVYATYKSTDSAWSPTPWPFDQGPQFIILNLAVGGSWPGDVNTTTVFPSTMQVEYVRVYTN
jgi:beta-glucanase (GH16 family)